MNGQLRVSNIQGNIIIDYVKINFLSQEITTNKNIYRLRHINITSRWGGFLFHESLLTNLNSGKFHSYFTEEVKDRVCIIYIVLELEKYRFIGIK